jgi:hypothetical protein
VAAAIHAVSEISSWACERARKPERDAVRIATSQPVGVTA